MSTELKQTRDRIIALILSGAKENEHLIQEELINLSILKKKQFKRD